MRCMWKPESQIICRSAREMRAQTEIHTSFSPTYFLRWRWYLRGSTQYPHPGVSEGSSISFFFMRFFNRKFASTARINMYKNLCNTFQSELRIVDGLILTGIWGPPRANPLEDSARRADMPSKSRHIPPVSSSPRHLDRALFQIVSVASGRPTAEPFSGIVGIGPTKILIII
jgi:hypothetical protein